MENWYKTLSSKHSFLYLGFGSGSNPPVQKFPSPGGRGQGRGNCRISMMFSPSPGSSLKAGETVVSA